MRAMVAGRGVCFARATFISRRTFISLGFSRPSDRLALWTGLRIMSPLFLVGTSANHRFRGSLRSAATFPSIVVVDDGSTDNTAKLAAESGARGRFAPPKPWERARPVKTGFDHRDGGKDSTGPLLMDGDGQHQAGDIPAFIQRAEATQAGLGDRQPHARCHVPSVVAAAGSTVG